MLDATKCLSYQTIEQKGPIPLDVASEMNGWIFGCDICNEVCPWNERFASDESEFDERFADTPLARPGLERMKRNVRAAENAGAGSPGGD